MYIWSIKISINKQSENQNGPKIGKIDQKHKMKITYIQ